MGKNNAKLPDLGTLIAAGINPKTGLPLKLGAEECDLVTPIQKQLRVLDEQNAVNRYKWHNLPNGLTGQLVERMLYYRGQVVLFYLEEADKFLMLPFSPSGTTDVYGRPTELTPLQWRGSNVTDKDKVKPFINNFTLKPVYDVLEVFDEEGKIVDFGGLGIILRDYTSQESETIISRQILQDPLLGIMAEAFPMARTSLIANSGVKGMRVNDESEESNVEAASRSVTRAALTGNPWIPIVGPMEFQDMTSGGSALKSEEYLLFMQALDNYRLSLYGLKNGGLFQKKSHMLEDEQHMNDGNVGLVYQDGLTIRQNFCDTVNTIFGLGIWCEASETVVGMDRNMDGIVADETDQSGQQPSEQPTGGVTEDEQ